MQTSFSCIAGFALALLLGSVPSAAQQPVAQSSPSSRSFLHRANTNPVITIDGKEVPLIKRFKGATRTANPNNVRKAPVRKSETYLAREIVREDFSLFQVGSPEAPAPLNVSENAGYLADGYMQQDGWYGLWAWQAGGMAYLEDPTKYYGAVLNTPLGDYSGDLTIRCRVKPMADITAPRFTIGVLRGGYQDALQALDKDGNRIEVNLVVPPNNQWSTIEYKVQNYSADKDGFIQFAAYEKLLIDDIEIFSSDGSFIASPNIVRPEIYHEDGFTINWDPVAWASNYDIELFQKEYTSEEERHYAADFEQGMPEGFTVEGNPTIGEHEGNNCLWLGAADKLYTPFNNSLYKSLKCRIKVVAPDATADELYNAKLDLWGRDDIGWTYLGYMWIDDFVDKWGEFDADFRLQGQFANHYYGMGFSFSGLPETTHFLFDDFDIQAGRDCEIVPSKDGYQYALYYAQLPSTQTSYTFTGLDMNKEYYYGVMSQNARHFKSPAHPEDPSVLTLYHAFGITDPVATNATEISSTVDGGSYTANWMPVNKATSYRVDNYGVTRAAQNGEWKLVDEDFSKIDGNYTEIILGDDVHSVNSDELNWDNMPDDANFYSFTSLDQFMQQPGWTGISNGLAQGWLALIPQGGPGEVRTPLLDLSHAEQCTISVSALSTPGEIFYVYVDDGRSFWTAFDENGVLDARFTIPVTGFNRQLTFAVYNVAMMKSIAVSQEVKAGDMLRSWASTAEVQAPETSVRFTGLNALGYDEYGYVVTAMRNENNESYTTAASAFVIATVNTVGVSSLNTERAKTIDAYFTVDGRRLSRPALHGATIVRYTDGTTKKVVALR